MAKKKTSSEQFNTEVIPENVVKEHKKYVKEHARKLRQIEREASGDNMAYPPTKEYD